MRWFEKWREVVATLRQRYDRWLYNQLRERLIADGYWNSSSPILAFMLPELVRRSMINIGEIGVSDRVGRYHVSRCSTVDQLLVFLMQAYRDIIDGEYVTAPLADKDDAEVHFDTYFSNFYGQPVKLKDLIPKLINTVNAFLDVLQKQTPSKVTYYQRRFELLIDESCRLLDLLLEEYL